MSRPQLIRGALALVGLAALVWVGLEAVSPGIDATHSLAWGAVLGSGVRPHILAPLAPLAHPLPIGLGAVLSPLGAGAAYATFSLVAALSYGLLLYAAYRLARVLAGGLEARRWALAAGILAVVLVLLRPQFEYFALFAVVEVPFSALLLLALALVLEDPRSRPWLPLALLAGAGLLRPDAWVLGIAYCAWLAYDGLRGRELALCAALALAAPAIWIAFAAILTSDPLSPIEGNPSAVAVEDYGFQGSRDEPYVSSLSAGLERHANGVRALIGYPLAIVGTLVALLCLLQAARRGRGTGKLALVSGCALVLFVQTVVLAQLGAPIAERYAFGPALLLVVLVAAVAFAPRAPAICAGLVAALLAVMMVMDPRKPEQIWVKLDGFSELRAENDDLLELTGRDRVRESVLGDCPNVYVGGRNRQRSLSARPVVAMAFDRDPIKVYAARAPRAKLEAAIFRRDLPVGPPPFETEGVWTFRSACLKGIDRKRANRDRRRRAERRRAVEAERAAAKYREAYRRRVAEILGERP